MVLSKQSNYFVKLLYNSKVKLKRGKVNKKTDRNITN